MIDSDFSGCKVTNFSPHKLMIFHRVCDSVCRYGKKCQSNGCRSELCLQGFSFFIFIFATNSSHICHEKTDTSNPHTFPEP